MKNKNFYLLWCSLFSLAMTFCFYMALINATKGYSDYTIALWAFIICGFATFALFFMFLGTYIRRVKYYSTDIKDNAKFRLVNYAEGRKNSESYLCIIDTATVKNCVVEIRKDAFHSPLVPDQDYQKVGYRIHGLFQQIKTFADATKGVEVA